MGRSLLELNWLVTHVLEIPPPLLCSCEGERRARDVARAVTAISFHICSSYLCEELIRYRSTDTVTKNDASESRARDLPAFRLREWRDCMHAPMLAISPKICFPVLIQWVKEHFCLSPAVIPYLVHLRLLSVLREVLLLLLLLLCPRPRG